MTYSLLTSDDGTALSVICSEDNFSIPNEPANRHYQQMLDAIIKDGDDCFEGDIPAPIQEAADAKKFSQQVEAYTIAVERLTHYQLSVGLPEILETVTQTELVVDPETGIPSEVETTSDVVVQRAVEPLEATIEVLTYGNPMEEPITEIKPNPVIVKDDLERSEAQAVIDATPTEVKEFVGI